MRTRSALRASVSVACGLLLLLVSPTGGAHAADAELPGWHGTMQQGRVKVKLDASCEEGDTRHPVRIEATGLTPRTWYQFFSVPGPQAQQGLGAPPFAAVSDEAGKVVYTGWLTRCQRGRELHLRIRFKAEGEPGATVFDGYFAETEP